MDVGYHILRGAGDSRRGFHSACTDVRPESKFVVYAGAERYRITPDTEAVPLLDLARELSRAT